MTEEELKSFEEQYKEILDENGKANGTIYFPDGSYEKFVDDIVVESNHKKDCS